MRSMCKEMKKLRQLLDERGIEWADASSITSDAVIQKCIEFGIDKYHADCTIYRTHFYVDGNAFSVIYGYGTYGGYDSFNGSDLELLECRINGGDPTGYMTAEDVIDVVDNIHLRNDDGDTE